MRDGAGYPNSQLAGEAGPGHPLHYHPPGSAMIAAPTAAPPAVAPPQYPPPQYSPQHYPDPGDELYRSVVLRPVSKLDECEPDEYARVPLWCGAPVPRVVARLEALGSLIGIGFLVYFAIDWPGDFAAPVSQAALVPLSTNSSHSAAVLALGQAGADFGVALENVCADRRLAYPGTLGYRFTGVELAYTHVSVTALVVAVVAIAGLMQGARAYVLMAEDSAKRLASTGATLAEWHVARPDLSRWVEYAITSPIQIAVVALAFGIYDSDTLWLLLGVQFGLVVFGAAIEAVTDAALFSPTCSAQAFLPVFLFLIASWLMHACVWVTIAGRWARNASIAGCEKLPWAPDEAWYLMLWQAITFTLFGISTTLTVLEAVVWKWQAEPTHGTEAFAARLWARSNARLSVLTAVAKTALEVSFLVLVFAMPASSGSELLLVPG